MPACSAVFSGGAGGARAPPEFVGSQKGRSLISAYQSLAITMNTSGFEKLNMALHLAHFLCKWDLVGDTAMSQYRAVFSFSSPGVFVVVAKL